MVWKGDATGRLAKSLITLIDQVDATWPDRDKSSDGTIGDAAHAARKSDHNKDQDGVVKALDLDRDISVSFSARRLAEVLVASRDPRINYIISDGQIIYSTSWKWQPYNGQNAHRMHIHVSVSKDPALYDDTRPWAISDAAKPAGPHMRFTSITATVFGGPSDSMSGNTTAYGDVTGAWWDRPGVALPWRFSGTRPKVRVRNNATGLSVVCDIIDQGPWNYTSPAKSLPGDPYWQTGARPQAESGTDQSGRRTNKAGIDLTPAAARAIGLVGMGLVDWDFEGVDGEILVPVPQPQTQPQGANILLPLLLMLLTQGKAMTDPTKPQTGNLDIGKVLLPLILQSVLGGKPINMADLLPVLLQGMGVQVALPPPAPVLPPPPPPVPQQSTSMNDLLLPLLLQLLGGAKPVVPPPVVPPLPVVMAADPTNRGTDLFAKIFGLLGVGGAAVLGTTGTIEPSTAMTTGIGAMLPLIGGILGIFNPMLGGLVSGGGRLFGK